MIQTKNTFIQVSKIQTMNTFIQYKFQENVMYSNQSSHLLSSHSLSSPDVPVSTLVAGCAYSLLS